MSVPMSLEDRRYDMSAPVHPALRSDGISQKAMACVHIFIRIDV